MKADTGTEFLSTKEKALHEDSFKLELQRFDTQGKLDEVMERTEGSDAVFWQRYIQAFVSCQSSFHDDACRHFRAQRVHHLGELAQQPEHFVCSARRGVTHRIRQHFLDTCARPRSSRSSVAKKAGVETDTL